MALEHLLPSLLSAVFAFAVGSFILIKGKKTVNKLFAIFCYGLAIQAIFAGFLYIADDPIGALHLDLISVVGIIIAISFFVYFAIEFTNIQKYKKTILIINYLLAIGFLVFTFTGQIFTSVEMEETGYAGVAGPMYNFFTGYLLLALLFGICVFIISFFISKKIEQKNRIKYILFSIVILGATALLDMFRKLGIFTLTNVDLTRFGIFIFLIGVSYTIVKFKLLNINFVLKKSVVFGIAMIITAILYMLIEKFFDKYFEIVFGSALGNASIFAALLIALFFDKIKEWTTKIIGIVFYFLFKKEPKRGRKKKIIKAVKEEVKKEFKKKKKKK